MPYPHPPQIMDASEIEAWADMFRKYREAGIDLDKKVLLPLWQTEGMIATIQSLIGSGNLASRANMPEETY